MANLGRIYPLSSSRRLSVAPVVAATPSRPNRDVTTSLSGAGAVSSGALTPACATSTTANMPAPRPSAAETKRMATQLSEFLLSRQYPFPFGKSTLEGPTIQEFRNLVNFIIQQGIDPTFSLPDPKTPTFKDDVAACFRAFGYPYSNLKSSLQSVGAPHTWPIVLGALVWLISLVTAAEQPIPGISNYTLEFLNTPKPADEVFDIDAQGSFEYMARSYNEWMRGGEMEFNDHERENARLASQVEALELELKAIQSEHHALRATEGQFASVLSRKNELISQCAAAEQALEQQKSVLRETEEKHKLRVEFASRRREQIATLEKEAQETKAVADRQSITPLEVAAIAQKKKVLRETKAMLEEQQAKLSEEIADLERVIHERIDTLAHHASEFNRLAVKLGIAPANAPWAEGRDWTISVDGSAEFANDIIDVDVSDRGDLAELLSDIKSRLSERVVQAARARRELAAEFERLGEDIEECKEKLTRLRNLLHKKQEQARDEKQEFNTKLSELADLVEREERELAAEAQTIAGYQDESTIKLREIEALIERTREQHDRERGMLNEEVCMVTDDAAHHMSQISAALESLEQQARKTVESISQL